MAELFIPIGISFSGKSTQTRPLLKQKNFLTVSPDDLRTMLSGDVNDQSKNRLVFDLVYDILVKLLNTGNNVYLDATNTNFFLLDKMINYINSKVNNVEFKLFPIDTNVQLALQRKYSDIEQNKIKKGLRSNVPDDILKKQYTQFTETVSKLDSLVEKYQNVNIVNNP